MKKMRWMYILGITVLLTSCGSIISAYKMDRKMQDIELGMSKKKVVSILGKNYETAGARITPEGPIESISYAASSISETVDSYYILNFREGILVEWFKDKHASHNNHNHTH